MRHLEDKLQIACVRWFSLQYTTLANNLHHSPNGGYRTAFEGLQFKRMGVRAGFPDLFLYVAKNGFHGMAIELKTEKGRQTDSQKQMQTLLEDKGYKYVVIRSLEQFVKEVNEYLK